MKSPETASELTLEWLNEIVPHEVDGCQLKSFEVDETFEADSMLCDVSRIEIEHGSARCAPLSLILKIPTQIADIAERTARSGLYEKEATNYALLSQHPDLAVPKFYGSYEGAKSGSPVVVIEDLSPAKPDRGVQYLAATDVESALMRIADVHSAFWGHDGLPVTAVETIVRFRTIQIDENWNAFIERFGDRLGAKREVFEWFRPNLSSFAGVAVADPQTLVHWDLNRGNLLFTQGVDREPMIVDWQTASGGLAAGDVSGFIWGAMSVEDRRSHEHELLKTYFDRLNSRVDSGGSLGDYTYDLFYLDYRATSIFSLFLVVAMSGGMGGRLVRDSLAASVERRFAQTVAMVDDLDPVSALKELGY